MLKIYNFKDLTLSLLDYWRGVVVFHLPPSRFILINLKMAFILTLTLLHFFNITVVNKFCKKKNCLIKGRVENGQTAGWCLKKSEMVNNILRYRAMKKVRRFFMSRPKSWTMDIFNTPLFQL